MSSRPTPSRPNFRIIPASDWQTLEAGMRAALADQALLEVVPGCALEEALDGGIDAAVAAARRADVVVLATKPQVLVLPPTRELAIQVAEARQTLRLRGIVHVTLQPEPAAQPVLWQPLRSAVGDDSPL